MASREEIAQARQMIKNAKDLSDEKRAKVEAYINSEEAKLPSTVPSFSERISTDPYSGMLNAIVEHQRRAGVPTEQTSEMFQKGLVNAIDIGSGAGPIRAGVGKLLGAPLPSFEQAVTEGIPSGGEIVEQAGTFKDQPLKQAALATALDFGVPDIALAEALSLGARKAGTMLTRSGLRGVDAALETTGKKGLNSYSGLLTELRGSGELGAISGGSPNALARQNRRLVNEYKNLKSNLLAKYKDIPSSAPEKLAAFKQELQETALLSKDSVKAKAADAMIDEVDDQIKRLSQGASIGEVEGIKSSVGSDISQAARGRSNRPSNMYDLQYEKLLREAGPGDIGKLSPEDAKKLSEINRGYGIAIEAQRPLDAAQRAAANKSAFKKLKDLELLQGLQSKVGIPLTGPINSRVLGYGTVLGKDYLGNLINPYLQEKK